MLKLNPASWCKLRVGDAETEADAWDMSQSGTSKEKEGESPRLGIDYPGDPWRSV